MNKKGQVLVLFLLLIPLILCFVCFVFEKIYINYEETKLNRESKEICRYVKKNIDVDNIKKYAVSIDEDIISVKINNNKMEIKKEIKSVFGFTLGKQKYKLVKKITCR